MSYTNQGAPSGGVLTDGRPPLHAHYANSWDTLHEQVNSSLSKCKLEYTKLRGMSAEVEISSKTAIINVDGVTIPVSSNVNSSGAAGTVWNSTCKRDVTKNKIENKCLIYDEMVSNSNNSNNRKSSVSTRAGNAAAAGRVPEVSVMSAAAPFSEREHRKSRVNTANISESTDMVIITKEVAPPCGENARTIAALSRASNADKTTETATTKTEEAGKYALGQPQIAERSSREEEKQRRARQRIFETSSAIHHPPQEDDEGRQGGKEAKDDMVLQHHQQKPHHNNQQTMITSATNISSDVAATVTAPPFTSSSVKVANTNQNTREVSFTSVSTAPLVVGYRKKRGQQSADQLPTDQTRKSDPDPIGTAANSDSRLGIASETEIFNLQSSDVSNMSVNGNSSSRNVSSNAAIGTNYCSRCGETITTRDLVTLPATGDMIEELTFHSRCFRCESCGEGLSLLTARPVSNGRVYCADHAPLPSDRGGPGAVVERQVAPKVTVAVASTYNGQIRGPHAGKAAVYDSNALSIQAALKAPRLIPKPIHKTPPPDVIKSDIVGLRYF